MLTEALRIINSGRDNRLHAYRVILGVRVSGVSSDDMADPSQRATAANPKTRRDNQPEYAGQNPAVVKLPYTGNHKTRKCLPKLDRASLLTSLEEKPYDALNRFVRGFVGM